MITDQSQDHFLPRIPEEVENAYLIREIGISPWVYVNVHKQLAPSMTKNS
jgi:hypothetical protein